MEWLRGVCKMCGLCNIFCCVMFSRYMCFMVLWVYRVRMCVMGVLCGLSSGMSSVWKGMVC